MILNHKIIGEGEPVIILHGLFGMLDNWQRFAKEIKEHFQVILVDQRNHGKSFRSESFTYGLLADDVIALMDHLNIDQARIIGHSMGGKTAMHLAEAYPNRLQSFVIVDIAPKTYEGGHQAIFESVLSVDVNAAISRKEIDAHLSQTIKEEMVRLFLMKNLKRRKEGGFDWKANFPVLHRVYQDIMDDSLSGSTDVPGLFIKGSNSGYIVESDKPAIRGYFPNANFHTIEGAGHWVHADKPTELLDVVLRFFSSK